MQARPVVRVKGAGGLLRFACCDNRVVMVKGAGGLLRFARRDKWVGRCSGGKRKLVYFNQQGGEIRRGGFICGGIFGGLRVEINL